VNFKVSAKQKKFNLCQSFKANVNFLFLSLVKMRQYL